MDHSQFQLAARVAGDSSKRRRASSSSAGKPAGRAGRPAGSATAAAANATGCCRNGPAKCRSNYDRASWLARCSFLFLWPINSLVRRHRDGLKSAHFDNYAPCACLCQVAGRQLEAEWRRELAQAPPTTSAAAAANQHHLGQADQTSRPGSSASKAPSSAPAPKAAGAKGKPKGPRQRPASLTRAVVRTYAREFGVMLALIALTDCVCEPTYFYFSILLIDCIGQFPGSRFQVGWPDEQQQQQQHNETISNSHHRHQQQFSTRPPGSGPASDELKLALRLNAVVFLTFICAAQLLNHPFAWLAHKLGLKLRVALAHLVYRKALRIETKAAEAPVAYKQAISLISRDVEQLESNLAHLPWPATATLQVLLLTLTVVERLDVWVALVAVSINAVIAIQRGHMNIRTRHFTRETARQADERVRLTTETLEAIRIIRMYAWTRPFERAILKLRKRELAQRSEIILVGSLDTALFFISCSAAAIITILFAHFGRGLPVTQALVSQVFLVSALYRRVMSRNIPQGILSWLNVLIVLKRCETYLCAAEQENFAELETANELQRLAKKSSNGLSPSPFVAAAATSAGPNVNECFISLDKKPPLVGPAAAYSSAQQLHALQDQQEPMVELKRVTFGWNVRDWTACLRDLSFSVQPAELVLVSGKVGCGKSTLLQLILGELVPTYGQIAYSKRPHQEGVAQPTLGQRYCPSDQVLMRPKMAYAPQQAWIFGGSVRENVLFGEPLNLERYYEVLRVCCLIQDLRRFPDYDRTIVGERGVTLSQGQKARINLARAIYQRAHLYLLDDPLSPVDAPVARYIFQEALRGFLRGKTIILVTHQFQYLKHADKILYLDLAQGAQFGTYDELEQNGVFKCLQLDTGGYQGHDSLGQRNSNLLAADEQLNTAEVDRLDRNHVIDRILSNRFDETEWNENLLKFNGYKQRNEMNELLLDERDQVSHAGQALAYYMRQAGSKLEWLVFVAANVACRFLFIGINLWLNYWAGFDRAEAEFYGFKVHRARDDDDAEAGQDDQAFVPSSFAADLSLSGAIYVSLTLWLCLVGTSSLRGYQYYTLTLRAAHVVHEKLIRSLLWTSMSFFDRTPHGHVINRISSDISHMDTTYLELVNDLSISGLSVLFIFGAIIASSHKTAIVVALIFFLDVIIFKYLTNLIETIKYLDGFRRSTLYSHVATTLDGLSIIRTSNKSDIFLAKFIALLDCSTSVRFINVSARRFIIGSLDWILIMFYISFVSLAVSDTLAGHGAYAFVGLNLVVQMARICQITFVRFLELYTTIQSIDRIREYSNFSSEQSELMLQYHVHANNNLTDLKRHLSQRAEDNDNDDDDDTKASKREATTSPRGPEAAVDSKREARDRRRVRKAMVRSRRANFTTGRVEFAGVSLKYLNTNKVVLNQLAFCVEPGERIGIIGRTGAGKSSLITVLFHLYHFEGFIYIDGQDTKELSLASLRGSISIIPQEPTLFSGTLRYNLDPLGLHDDAELWQALEVVRLDKSLLANQSQAGYCAMGQAPSLDQLVCDSGENFSVGQRQLICLARALLKRNKLLVLDEATANVDQQTDQLVQLAIRNEFKDCTVLTIAHRLETIVDSDRIMIMQEGRICELGKPAELLESGQLLNKMIDSTGRQQAALLRARIMANSSAPPSSSASSAAP